MPLAVALALAGFILVGGPVGYYFTTISREKVPVDPTRYNVTIALGVVVGLAGILLAPAATTGILGGVAVGLGGFFLWLMSMRHLPDGELVARLGEPLPALEAPDQDGDLVRLSDLKGQRVMLKLFRGSW